MRKTHYQAQKLGLVVTYEDETNGEWHMLMPNEVREALTELYPTYKRLADNDIKPPSPRDLRIMSAMHSFFGGEE